MKLSDVPKKEYRLSIGYILLAPEKCCLFCKYCTDIFFDPLHEYVPYGGICLANCHMNGLVEICKSFKER